MKVPIPFFSMFWVIQITLTLTVSSCVETESNKTHSAKVNSKPIGNTCNTGKDCANQKFDYVIFGRFCGECGGECATMYKLDVRKHKLFIDHSDSYWEHSTNMQFATTNSDPEKYTLARQVLDSIPNIFFTSEIPMKALGCPDCTDGCGIHLEFKTGKTIRRFAIDYQTEQLHGEIKVFAEHLKSIIERI